VGAGEIAPDGPGSPSNRHDEMVERCLNGRVELDYPPVGVTWRLTCPAANVLAPPANGSESPT
jgi:hypothetical protein